MSPSGQQEPPGRGEAQGRSAGSALPRRPPRSPGTPGRPLAGQEGRGQAHLLRPPARGSCPPTRVPPAPLPPALRAAQTCPGREGRGLGGAGRPGGGAGGLSRHRGAEPRPQVIRTAPPEGVRAAERGTAEE